MRKLAAVLVVLAALAARAEDPTARPAGGPDSPQSRWETGVAVNALAASPDGKWVVVGGGNGKLKMLPTAGGAPKDFDVSSEPIVRLLVTPDSKYLITESTGSKLQVWSSATGAGVASIDLTMPSKSGTPAGSVSDLVPWPSGCALVRLGTGVEVFEARTGKRASELKTPPRTISTSGSPDGGLVAFAGTEALSVFKKGGKDATWSVPVRPAAKAAPEETDGCEFYSVRFSRDGAVVVSMRADEKRQFLQAYDAAKGKSLWIAQLPTDAGGGDVLVGNEFVVVPPTKAAAGWKSVFDVKTGAALSVASPPEGDPSAACVAADGKTLWVGTRAGLVVRVEISPPPPGAK